MTRCDTKKRKNWILQAQEAVSRYDGVGALAVLTNPLWMLR